jgi:phosphoserine phosphatase
MDRLEIPSRPLCVDLDGTLVETDTMEDLIVSFLRAHFWRCWMLPLWLVRGRAYFKQKLAGQGTLRVEALPVNAEFFRFLEEQHAAGRTLVLVSAADEKTVRHVAAHFKIFATAIGSDGRTNLRSAAKLQRLTDLYGPKGFDYAGNSSMDLPVWQGAAEAIVVNASPAVERRARAVANVTQTFPGHLTATDRMKRWLKLATARAS